MTTNAEKPAQERLCRHCRWYSPIWTPARAQYIDWCGHPQHSGVTHGACKDWQREPGADDE